MVLPSKIQQESLRTCETVINKIAAWEDCIITNGLGYSISVSDRNDLFHATVNCLPSVVDPPMIDESPIPHFHLNDSRIAGGPSDEMNKSPDANNDSAEIHEAIKSHHGETSTEVVSASTKRVLPPLPGHFKTVLKWDYKGEKLLQGDKVLCLETKWQLKLFLELLPALRKDVVELFCDQEGDKLSRYGTLSLLQMTFAHLSTTFVLDVTVLGSAIFMTPGSTGLSLGHILEDPDISKVYFDVRMDSDALFYLFGIHLRGIIDLQLMEVCCRGPLGDRPRLMALDRCVLAHLELEWDEEKDWHKAKARGKAHCRKHGYSQYDVRPLPEALQKYAAQDTMCMPHLYATYLEKLQGLRLLANLILTESQRRADDDPPTEFLDKVCCSATFVFSDSTSATYGEFTQAKFTSRELELVPQPATFHPPAAFAPVLIAPVIPEVPSASPTIGDQIQQQMSPFEWQLRPDAFFGWFRRRPSLGSNSWNLEQRNANFTLAPTNDREGRNANSNVNSTVNSRVTSSWDQVVASDDFDW